MTNPDPFSHIRSSMVLSIAPFTASDLVLSLASCSSPSDGQWATQEGILDVRHSDNTVNVKKFNITILNGLFLQVIPVLLLVLDAVD